MYHSVIVLGYNKLVIMTGEMRKNEGDVIKKFDFSQVGT